MPDSTPSRDVMRYRDFSPAALEHLLSRFGMSIECIAEGQPIPGSFWGEEEAGLRGNRLLLRPDTPLHSALHEACHYICMDEARRRPARTWSGR